VIAVSNQVSVRLWAIYSLFSMADSDGESAKADYLASVEAILLNPPPGLAFAVSMLANAIEGHLKSPEAVPTLAALLGSTQIAVRSAAPVVLGDIATPEVVEPLAKIALNDSDERVRAVVLDLTNPLDPGRRLRGTGGDTGLNEAVGVNRNHGLTYRLVGGTARVSPELLCGAGQMGEEAWATSSRLTQHSFGWVLRCGMKMSQSPLAVPSARERWCWPASSRGSAPILSLGHFSALTAGMW
jgi:hypothetical protein